MELLQLKLVVYLKSLNR